MKKIFLYFIASITLSGAWAQIPNASFETWGKDSTESLDKWVIFGDASKTNQAHSGNAAMKLTHEALAGQVYLQYGAAGLGGWPYVGRPDSVSFFVKGSLKQGDSGQIIVSLGRMGSPIGYSVLNFGVTDSVNYTEVKIPISFFVPVVKSDTMGIIFVLGQKDSLDSWMMVDDIKVTKNGTTEGSISNPGFETWNLFTSDRLTGWTTTNEVAKFFGFGSVLLAEKTTDANDGSSALKLTNKSVGSFSIFPGAAATGNLELMAMDQGPTFPVNKKYLSVTGFYKYAPKNNDTAKIKILMYFEGVEVGGGEYRTTATVNSYAAFAVPIKYDKTFINTPDSATIMIYSGDEDGDPQDGSVLYVDQLALSEQSGISEATQSIQTFIYPNPANQLASINYNSIQNEYVTIQLIDLTGQVVQNIYQGKLASGFSKFDIQTSHLAEGLYMLRTATPHHMYSHKLQITK